MNKLLAKSEPQTTLEEHINDGLKVLKELQKCFPTALHFIDEIWQILKDAFVFHDLGKAHSEFQRLLKNEKNKWYGQRHELFSLPFISNYDTTEKKLEFILRIVAGHHKTYEDLLQFSSLNYQAEDEFLFEFQKVDFDGVKTILNQFGYNQIEPYLSFDIIDFLIQNRESIEKYKLDDYLNLLILFGAFKQIDHLASAYIYNLAILSEDNFSFLSKKRVELQQNDLDFYQHQIVCGDAIGNAILTAPTGSGKTESAMLWLKNQLTNSGQGRTFYILPYTASINAMYERLSDEDNGFGEKNVAMIHGKLDAYLYDYFSDESSVFDRKQKIKTIREQFKTLQKPLKIVTPFQLLKHLFGLKGFEKGVFEWVGCHFIFDEIHAYNATVFAQIIVLLEFVQRTKSKIFIMTATLPTFMKDRLSTAIGESVQIKATNKLYQTFYRHKLEMRDGFLIENLSEIKSKIDDNIKVLIVCNTVENAQKICDLLTEYSPLLIHGGFNAYDRNDKEKELKVQEAQVLIGTQAIEVSLDIDYDVIYSEIAPLDALIQRFGRVNRKRNKGICSCIVFKEQNEKDKYIYPDNAIENTRIILQRIIDEEIGMVKEEKLQEYIDFVYPCFGEKEQNEFNQTYNFFTDSLERTIRPFQHSEEREEEFYKQFDGVKVVPAEKESEYLSKLNLFDFIGAELLKVQIRKWEFSVWLNDGGIEKARYCIERKDSYSLIDVNYFVLKKKYNSHIGLQKKIDTQRIFNNQL